MQESEKYLLIYAYGTTDKGTKLDNGTIERVEKSLDLIKKQGSDTVHVLLGAGIDPRFPYAPTLKSLMHNYIFDQLETQEYEKLVVYEVIKDAFGTFKETQAVIEMLEFNGITNQTIYVVSHEFHRKRIEYIWSFFGQYKVEFIACDDAYKGSDTLEPLKMLKVFLLGNLYRLKKLFK